MILMLMLIDFVIKLLNNAKIDNAPINVKIGSKYYDVKAFFYDEEICEYILELEQGLDYDTRSEPVDPNSIVWKIIQ